MGSGSRTWGEKELGGGSESLSGFPICQLLKPLIEEKKKGSKKNALVSRLRSGESRVINSSGSIGLGGTSWASSICNGVNRAGCVDSQTN